VFAFTVGNFVGQNTNRHKCFCVCYAAQRTFITMQIYSCTVSGLITLKRLFKLKLNKIGGKYMVPSAKNLKYDNANNF
jgi:hypothetical protein